MYRHISWVNSEAKLSVACVSVQAGLGSCYILIMYIFISISFNCYLKFNYYITWFLLFFSNQIPSFLKGLRLNSRYFPQNNIFTRQCNLFAYRKYMPTHSHLCCQSPGIILMRNINGRCPENMLVLVPIASQAMVAAIVFNFCGR